MEVDRNGLEVLTRDECVRLLATVPLGRIAFSARALPTILPVNFVVMGQELLMLTGRGSSLDTATRDTVVAFEADGGDGVDHPGWSVVVTGVAREMAPDEVGSVDVSRLRRWSPGRDRAGDGRLIAVSLDVVSGRRAVGCTV